MGRDKIIIDADKVPGRRHLLLIDPEQFRLPFPFALPREGSPVPPDPKKGTVPLSSRGQSPFSDPSDGEIR